MALVDEIREAGDGLAAAINAGDATAAAACYTPDGAVMAPGAPRADGTEAVKGFFAAAIAGGLSGVSLTPSEVEAHGDAAVEVGVIRAGDAVGKYIVVWKRQGGAWKLHRDCFNFDA